MTLKTTKNNNSHSAPTLTVKLIPKTSNTDNRAIIF